MLIGLVVIVTAFVTALVWRSLQAKALGAQGIPVTGTVLRKFATGGILGGGGKRIVFAYRSPDGRNYRRAALLSPARWNQCDEGGPIALVMLADRPGVCAPAWNVEDARKAMQI